MFGLCKKDCSLHYVLCFCRTMCCVFEERCVVFLENDVFWIYGNDMFDNDVMCSVYVKMNCDTRCLNDKFCKLSSFSTIVLFTFNSVFFQQPNN